MSAKTKINLDHLYNAGPKTVGKRAFRFITKFDHDFPVACALGLAMALLRVCNHWQVDVKEFLRVAEKIYDRKAHEEPELRAVDQYIREET